MARPALELADIFRKHGPGWRAANRGHISLVQLKAMSAIETCRTAALGGHVAACENSACGHMQIAYNSCRNRLCPKCQGAAAREWMEAREAELLPVQYFHQVFTIPAALADIAYQNKAVIYHLLFKASAGTKLTIAADPKHLGARVGFIAVPHTWGSAMSGAPNAAAVCTSLSALKGLAAGTKCASVQQGSIRHDPHQDGSQRIDGLPSPPFKGQ
jgi:Transposase zinc-binding domain